jgi:ubiquinone/menaquinone biosynthesis C-methylase UbiE
MEIYDAISDDYHLFTRQNEAIATRLRHAVRKIVGDKSPSTKLMHLDFGCGPGHVLGWLKEFNFQQIGMDVSLNNLRNARKNTGALVVCGDACNMPFKDQSMDLVTESSVLHHILNWKLAVNDAIRVSKRTGGIVIDSEPSQAQLAWSGLAVAVFDFRFIVYKALSYVRRDKYIFRDTNQAKLNLLAEIHHQPGTGFPVEEIAQLFTHAGFKAEIVSSPTPQLVSRAAPGWKGIVLNILSCRNPWNPIYGPFTGVAVPRQN